jgi:hypothetical protein
VPAPPLLVSCLTHLYVTGRTDEGGTGERFWMQSRQRNPNFNSQLPICRVTGNLPEDAPGLVES